jgi:hypothetical protein
VKNFKDFCKTARYRVEKNKVLQEIEFAQGDWQGVADTRG